MPTHLQDNFFLFSNGAVAEKQENGRLKIVSKSKLPKQIQQLVEKIKNTLKNSKKEEKQNKEISNKVQHDDESKDKDENQIGSGISTQESENIQMVVKMLKEYYTNQK